MVATEGASLTFLYVIVRLSSVLLVCPDKQPGLSLWSKDPYLPSANFSNVTKNVTINKRILLDTSPPRLDGITIGPEGKLVVSPDTPIKLFTNYIHIYGEMDIGSEACPFDGHLEVVLTGQRGAYHVPGFGEKFIGVSKGGTLEIHGKKKHSWTKLSKTVEKVQKSDYIIKRSVKKYQRNNWKEGISIYTVNPTNPKKYRHRFFHWQWTSSYIIEVQREFKNFLRDIPHGWVVLVSVVRTSNVQLTKEYVKSFSDAFEDVFFKDVSSLFRTLSYRDIYVMTAVKGNNILLNEKVTEFQKGLEWQTASLAIDYNNYRYTIYSNLKNRGKQLYFTEINVLPLEKVQPIIDVIDDVTSWDAGDEVFFTSIDFDMHQAETGRIVKCDSCKKNQFKVDLPFRFTHFGEVENRVDMRGEVGLLTRHVKVRGETESFCPESNGNCGECPLRWDQRTCGKYLYDTFGGHIKFLKDFANVHIEGLELENMGQQTSPGSYPFHFHMCEDVGNYPFPPYLRDNSIHNSFARCITIHGTDGVLIQDNVAFKILGHCYFLEDGGEKHNVFDGNLGAVIRAARLIPSDYTPAVFWITNPLVTLVNNVAAGSEFRGIWFIYPREPIMASKGKGFMKYANQTAITKVDNNVIHSCGNGGLRIDGILEPDNTITRTAQYEARETPGDMKSPVKKVVIKRITAYKNAVSNIWFQGSFIEVTKSSVAESQNGVTLASTMTREVYLTDTIIIGESKRNLGEPTKMKVGRKWKHFSRALPTPWDIRRPHQGFSIYTGPIYGENLWFDGYKTNEIYTSGALSFIRAQSYGMSVISTMKDIGFGFDDSFSTGNRVFDGTEGNYGYTNLDGDKGSTFFWQERGEQIVKPLPFYYTNKDCYMRENWKMVACKLIYGKLNVEVDLMGPGERKPELEMRRDDIPNERETLVGTLTGTFTVILGGTHSYSLHWKGRIPRRFSVTGEALQRSHTVRLAICMPKNATFELWSESPKNRSSINHWNRVNTTSEVDRSADGHNYMYDKEKGLLFVKFVGLADRRPNLTSTCAGKCPVIKITISAGDRTKGNCTEEMYPKFQRYPPTSDNNIIKDNSVIPKTSSVPPENIGAGPTKPFEFRAMEHSYERYVFERLI